MSSLYSAKEVALNYIIITTDIPHAIYPLSIWLISSSSEVGMAPGYLIEVTEN